MKIREETEIYLVLAIYELRAAAVTTALAEIKKIKAAVERLRVLLRTSSTAVESAYVRKIFRYTLKHEMLPPPNTSPFTDPMGDLLSLLDACSDACDEGLKELKDVVVQREGQAWERWVRDLTSVLASSNLPVGARKDGAKTSPFVCLVRELHGCIPSAYRRHHHSDDALAKAINKAQRKDGT